MTIPKSSNRERLQDNLDATGIGLEPADVARIGGLDGTEPHVADPNTFGH